MSPDRPLLRDLFRCRPGRATTLSLLPVVLAGAQGTNALVYGIASPLVAVFVLVLLAFAVGATRHSLASLRAERIDDRFDD